MEPGSPLTFTNGQVVFERYRLKSLVGKGGAGTVWRALDQELDIDIALKFLSEDLLFDASALADLKRETRRGMSLAHPHIVRIYGFFQSGKTAAIAMEYVEGNTLAALQASRARPFFEIDEISEWTRQLCGALHYAHSEVQLVHRDLKPGNLMIDDRGRLKVSDFGIAAGLNDAHTRRTGVADTRGTLPYMSPQQLLGQKPAVEHDIYSLGATLYDLVTGRPPFHRGDISLQVRTISPPFMEARRSENGFSGGPVPPAWEATIASCLDKDASRRPGSAAQVSEMLGLGAAGLPVPFGAGTRSPLPAVTISPELVPSQPTRLQHPGAVAIPRVARERRPFALVAAGALLAVALVGLGVGGALWLQRSSRTPPVSGSASVQPAATAGAVKNPDGSFSFPRQAGRSGPADAAGGRDGGPGEGPRGNGPGPKFYPPANDMALLDRPVAEHPVKLPGSGIELVWIPRGSNQIGIPDDAPGDRNEYPETGLDVTDGYWLGKYEVSAGEYLQVVGRDPNVARIPADRPVTNISWGEAMEFCRLLTAREAAVDRLPAGFSYTLPTEAQWEYAAKGGGGGPFGSVRETDFAKFAWSSLDGVQAPQKRGLRASTPWNLYDIYGNVSEWCRDWYEDHRPGGRVADYAGPAAGTERVVKGGSFADEPRALRSSVRNPMAPEQRDARVGFRLALTKR